MRVPTADTVQQYADTVQQYALKPLSRLDGRGARSGLAAGAALVVLSAASAAVSALRERSKS